MSKTPSQKRRRDFASREAWGHWVCAVAIGGGGRIRINGYSWRSGATDLWRGAQHAKWLGWMTEERRTRFSDREFILTDAGWEAGKQHARRGAK